MVHIMTFFLFFFFQAEDGIRDATVTGVRTCALPISGAPTAPSLPVPEGCGMGVVWTGGLPRHGGSPLSISVYASRALTSGTAIVVPSGKAMTPPAGVTVVRSVCVRYQPAPKAILRSSVKACFGGTVKSCSGTNPVRQASPV